MIEMIKSSAISFLLKTDIQGIEEMLMYIKELNGRDREYPQILYLGKKRNLEIELNTDVDKMLISEDVIKVYMEEEELEYFEQRLENALISGCFYPAEICERKYKNRYVTIYCDIIFLK